MEYPNLPLQRKSEQDQYSTNSQALEPAREESSEPIPDACAALREEAAYIASLEESRALTLTEAAYLASVRARLAGHPAPATHKDGSGHDDLTMDDLAGTEDDSEVIESLTEGDMASVEAVAPKAPIPAPDIVSAPPEPEPEPKRDPAQTLKLIQDWKAKDAAKRAARRRATTNARVRKHRAKKKAKAPASPPAPAAKLGSRAMLEALQKAVAGRASTDRFLEKLAGREREFTRFRVILEHARRLNPKVSDQEIAELWTAKTGVEIDRHKAKRLRNVVEKLLAPGGVWHA